MSSGAVKPHPAHDNGTSFAGRRFDEQHRDPRESGFVRFLAERDGITLARLQPDPGAETGGTFTNAVNRASSHFRNVHMYRLLTAAVLQGERVFAVVGRNHVPMQAQAIKCALDAR